MPSSHYRHIPDVIEAVLSIDPRRVLEVGIGCGKYGALLREYLGVWEHHNEPWGAVKIDIEGIEVCALYSDSPAWKCYSVVYIRDALDVLPEIGAHYDMALMVDVLEHFTLEDGARVLALLFERAPAVVVAVPGEFFETLPIHGNTYEHHRADWTAEHLRSLGYSVEVRRDDEARVMVLRQA